MKKDLENKAIELRKNGKSYRYIAKELEVSKGSVSKWVKHIVLSEDQAKKLRQNMSELKINNKGNRKFFMTKRLEWQKEGANKAKEKDSFHAFVCALYWGEGAKNRNMASITNTDKNILIQWVRFLSKYFDVDKEKIKISCACHEKGKIKEVENYWIEILGLSNENLTKTVVYNYRIEQTGKKKNIHKYGCCSVRICDTRIVQHIFGAIQEYGNFENEMWIQ